MTVREGICIGGPLAGMTKSVVGGPGVLRGRFRDAVEAFSPHINVAQTAPLYTYHWEVWATPTGEDLGVWRHEDLKLEDTLPVLLGAYVRDCDRRGPV